MKKASLVLFLVALILTCTHMGTNDETNTSISARIFESDGKTPSVGATVKVFTSTATDRVAVAVVYTDATGKYELKGLTSGTYNVCASNISSLAKRLSKQTAANDSDVSFQSSVTVSGTGSNLKNDTLTCPSTLTGYVKIQPQDNPQSITVQVVGTDKYFENTDINGKFVMSGMAAGTYNLLFETKLTNYTSTAVVATVNSCAADMLKDSAQIIFTGIPVVLGITATYDTTNGVVHLKWNSAAYRDLSAYLIYRDSVNAITLSSIPVAVINDTTFTDTIFWSSLTYGQFSFYDSSDYRFSYRVGIRNNAGAPGPTYKNVTVVAASPEKTGTKFTCTKWHVAKKFFTDSSSVNDTILYSMIVSNPTRALRSISWTDLTSNTMVSQSNFDTTLKTDTNKIKYVWSSVGVKRMYCQVVDMAGVIWRDSVSINVVQDNPVLLLTSPDANCYLGDSVHVHASASDKYGSIVKIEWRTDSSSNFSGSSRYDTVFIAPNTIGAYTIYARVTDDDGNVTTNTLNITVNMFKAATLSAAFSPRYCHTSVVFDNKMWVIGGVDSTGVKNDVWYSSDGITWAQATASAAFPPRCQHTTIVFNNMMWVIGGLNSSSNIDKNDVWYSNDGITWTQATDSAAFCPRYSHSSIVFDNKMWVIGGSFNQYYPTLWISAKADVWYSSDGITWTEAIDSAAFDYLAGQTSVVSNSKMWLIGGEKWVIGGCGGNSVRSSSDGITWTEATPKAAFSIRMGFTSILFNNKMWAIGGSTCTGYVNDAWYSSDGITWTQLSSSAGFSPRSGHTSVVYNNKMWVIGGNDASGSKNDVWYSGVQVP